MKNSIGQEEFTSIVSAILEFDPDVQDYSIKDKSISLSIHAPMRRESVNAFLDFNDHDAITGRFSYAQTDANAQKPREIGGRIADAIQRLLRQ